MIPVKIHIVSKFVDLSAASHFTGEDIERSFKKAMECKGAKLANGKTAVELSEIVSGKDDTEDGALHNELVRSIDAFLKKQSTAACDMFVMRYFYNDPISDIARFCACSEAKVKTTLHRTRNDLKDYLTKEGYSI